MKALIFAAAALTAGTAFAQVQTTPPAPPAPATPPMESQAAPSAAEMQQPSGVTTTDGTVPGDGITQQQTDPQGVAVAPPGTNQRPVNPNVDVVPAMNQQTAFTPRPATGPYPPCSRTVTDGCVQTYERGPR